MSLVGIFAGPFVIIYALQWNSPENWTAVAAFFSAIALGWSCFSAIRATIEFYLPLEWDERSVRWMFRTRQWSDLRGMHVLNQIERSSVTDVITDFERCLIFTDEAGKERLRIPYYQRDYAGRQKVTQDDPAWKEFLHAVERRYLLSPGSLAAGQTGSVESIREYAKGGTPHVVLGTFVVTSIAVTAGLLVFKADSLTIKAAFAVCCLVMMAVVHIGKKRGWDKGVRYFMRKWKG
jgi:hypothetical protein